MSQRGPLAALRLVLADLAALFERDSSRLWFLLLAAMVLQVGFWYVASPGPTLLGMAPRNLPHAALTVAWSLVFLLIVPALLMGAVGMSASVAGLRWGDARFGLGAAAAGAVIAVPLMYLGSFDAGLQATYPWAGAWVGRSVATIAAWAGIYALYYVAFEFFYRGFLLRLLDTAWGPVAALWVQTLAASLVHLGKPMPEVLAAIPASLVFGVIALRSRSIVYSTLLHLAIGLSTDLFSLAHQGLLLRR